MKKVKISELLKLCLCLCFVGLLGACETAYVANYEQAQVFPEDKLRALFPPEAVDYLQSQDTVALTGIQVDPSLSEHHSVFVTNFVRSLLEEAAYLQVLPQEKVNQVQKQTEFSNTSVYSVKDALALGTLLKTKYVATLKIEASDEKEHSGEWRAQVQMSIYNTHYKEEVFEAAIDFSTARMRYHWNQIKPKLQKEMPIRGFILETKNQRQLAKVNIGKQQRMREGRELRIFQRLQKKTEEEGEVLTETFYVPRGRMTLTHVFEHESYGVIDENGRDFVHQGDVVFSLPE